MNADLEMQEIMRGAAGKTLLLHSCCAPCSSACLERLAPVFSVTVFFYNPNMDTAEEYLRRKEEEIRFLNETGLAAFLDCDYSPEDYRAATSGLEGEPEGGARCRECFRLRLTKTAERAKADGFDYFATTLTLSPLKNAALINALGEEIGREHGVFYLPSDFKKRNGYLRSVELSKEHSLYRQNYCGCVYSKRTAAAGAVSQPPAEE